MTPLHQFKERAAEIILHLAADTSVRQADHLAAARCRPDNGAIDVHIAEFIHQHSRSHSGRRFQIFVQKRCLARAEKPGQQRYGKLMACLVSVSHFLISRVETVGSKCPVFEVLVQTISVF